MAKKIKYCKNHPNRKSFCRYLCSTCYNIDLQRRAREKANAQPPVKKEKPKQIKKTSEIQAALNTIYGILRKELLPKNRTCQAQYQGCTHRATQIHHMQGRKRHLLIMSKQFKFVCPECHTTITEHSAEAIENGLSMLINSKTKWDFTERELSLMDKYGVKAPK